MAFVKAKYIFFDTETNGLPRSWKAPVMQVDNWPRLVWLVWATFDAERKPLDHQNFLIRPDRFSIPYVAERVHGITTEHAAAHGYPVRAVLEQFANALEGSQAIIAHNIDFDEKVVGAEFIRLGHKHLLLEKPRLCTMKTTSRFCGIPGPCGDKWPTLSELHRTLFQRGYKGAHNPVADVAACVKCYFELEKRGVLSVDELLSVRSRGR